MAPLLRMADIDLLSTAFPGSQFQAIHTDDDIFQRLALVADFCMLYKGTDNYQLILCYRESVFVYDKAALSAGNIE